MKKIAYACVSAALFLGITASAFASIGYDPSAPTAPQPQFGFYCFPYTASFVAGGYYTPGSIGNTCTYQLPAQQMASSSIFLAVYRGVPGHATLAEYDFGGLPPASVVQTSPNDWGGSQGDDFFAVALGYDNFSDVLNENNFLTTGGADPGVPYSILPFKWGTAPPQTDITPPTIVIATPAQGASYVQNDTVPVQATLSDASGVATSSYMLDGKAIDPSKPLPLASVATGPATFVVSATDTAGNMGYATTTFTILPPDHTPPSITIVVPQQYGLYAKTDTVYPSANITDQSPIATTTYWFNNTIINPANPLPLSTVSVPSVDSVTVSAADKFGNAATSTVKFFVVKSTNSCLQDIVTVLTLILQDKTLPNKPTIVQLISDCSALLKGQHRGY